MSEQEVEMSPSGELNFKLPQQQWSGNDATQVSYFAGQQMIIQTLDDEYELHYLGLKVGGFAEMEDAQFNAAGFARSVLQILGEFIRDD